MSVGDQSRSQLAGRGRSFFHLLCKRRHVTPVAPPRQLMFPVGLLKWNVRAPPVEGRPRACAANTVAKLSARTTAANRKGIESRGYSRGRVVTADDIRAVAQTLPRSYEVFVHGQIKFRVGQIVWLALSKDGERMGCGFPKEMRHAAVEAEPHKFQLPSESDMRFNWIHVCLDAIDSEEMRDLVEEAWSRAVPLYVAQEYGRARGYH